MRTHLLGYVLGVLDDSERERVRLHLETDVPLRRDMERLASRLTLFTDDEDNDDPPRSLAARTCAYVEAHQAENAAFF